MAMKTKKINMKKFLKKLDWIWDYYFVYFLYNGNKGHKYKQYMLQKWGRR